MTAIDDHGVEASPLDIVIVLCSDCSGRGNCNFTTIQISETEQFKRVSCDCRTGYTGFLCSFFFRTPVKKMYFMFFHKYKKKIISFDIDFSGYKAFFFIKR